MKKINFKLILCFIGIILCVISMNILVIMTKRKLVDKDPTKQYIIIVDKQMGDTIINRALDSFSPKELDKLTKILNER